LISVLPAIAIQTGKLLHPAARNLITRGCLPDTRDVVVSVREEFRAYAPPTWVAPTVRRLLDSLPSEHLIGLSSVVLTESGMTGREKIRRRAGRKHSTNERLGFYRPTWRGEPPCIYLIVDNIVAHKPLRFQIARDNTLAEVLFHEVGHHLNAKAGLISRNEETSAEAWSHKLWRGHVRKRYWFLKPLSPLFKLLLTIIRAHNARRSAPQRRHERLTPIKR